MLKERVVPKKAVGMSVLVGETPWHQDNAVLTEDAAEIAWLGAELSKWRGIQTSINESQEREEEQVLQRTWSTDVTFLRMYHTIVDVNSHFIWVLVGSTVHAGSVVQLF